MKTPLTAFLLVILVSVFSLAGVSHFGAILAFKASDSFNAQLDVRYDGLASFTIEKVHTSSYSAKLVIPIGASPHNSYPTFM
jgi:hypothetical protein